MDRLALVVVGNDHALKTCPKIIHVLRKTEHCHDLGGCRDDEVILPHRPVGLAAKTDGDISKSPVVHVHAPLPDDAGRIDAQGITEMKVIVDCRREQVVGGGDRVEVTGEVEVQLVHRDDLRIAAAGSSALDAEARSQGRLAQGEDCVLSDRGERIGKTDADRSLPFACRRRVDGRHQNQMSVLTGADRIEIVLGELCLVSSVELQVLLRDVDGRCDVLDRALYRILRNFDITLHDALLPSDMTISLLPVP